MTKEDEKKSGIYDGPGYCEYCGGKLVRVREGMFEILVCAAGCHDSYPGGKTLAE